MGKNRIIKILGNVIGNIVVHKILIKHTNKPESLNHLESEVDAYRDNALEIANEFNWNKKDLEEIKSEALKKFEKDMKKYYSDVKFPINESDKLIEKTLKEIIIKLP